MVVLNPPPKKMNDVSTPKLKRKIDLSAIVEEENDTKLPDILNVREKIANKGMENSWC